MSLVIVIWLGVKSSLTPTNTVHPSKYSTASFETTRYYSKLIFSSTEEIELAFREKSTRNREKQPNKPKVGLLDIRESVSVRGGIPFALLAEAYGYPAVEDAEHFRCSSPDSVSNSRDLQLIYGCQERNLQLISHVLFPIGSLLVGILWFSLWT